MDNLRECEGLCEQVHDVFCGLLRYQWAFIDNSSGGEIEVCFTHDVEEWQVI